MTGQTPLERQIRAVLIDRRPAGGAPEALRARVLAVSVVHPHRTELTGALRIAAVPLAAAGIGMAAILLAALGFTREPLVALPPAGGGVVQGFDPQVEGPGFIQGVIPSAIYLGVAVAIVGGAAVLGTFFGPRAGTNRGRAIILLGLMAVGAGAWLVRFDVGLVDGGLSGAPVGYIEAPTGPFDDSDTTWLEVAAPGEPTMSIFALRNTSAVPVRVEGFQDTYRSTADVADWTAVWVPADGPGFGAPSLDKIVPFRPITLEPGQGLTLYLAGRAGRCAFGPTFDPQREYSAQELVGYRVRGPEITVAYSVFGLMATAGVSMRATFMEPHRADCFATNGPSQ